MMSEKEKEMVRGQLESIDELGAKKLHGCQQTVNFAASC